MSTPTTQSTRGPKDEFYSLEPFLQLITLQEFAGYWTLSEKLALSMQITLNTLQERANFFIANLSPLASELKLLIKPDVSSSSSSSTSDIPEAPKPKIESGEKKEDVKEDTIWSRVAVTFIALLILKTKYASKDRVWKLVGTKARRWLKGTLGIKFADLTKLEFIQTLSKQINNT